MGTLLDIRNLSLSYHSRAKETCALDGINLTVNHGEFVSILGPSGCGKSTLLSVIAGLEKPSAGSVTFFPDEDFPGKATIGYMFQHDLLLEWRTVWQNACLGPEIRRQLTPETEERIRSMLETYGLGAFLNHKPSQLSGGMRQRVALIRTLALTPELLLLDEPFSALDYQTRLSVADEVWQILRDQKKTSILVTHDIAEAISLGDRVIILSARPARLRCDIPIYFSGDRHPLAVRSQPAFQSYFQQIWEVMQHET